MPFVRVLVFCSFFALGGFCLFVPSFVSVCSVCWFCDVYSFICLFVCSVGSLVVRLCVFNLRV